MHIHSQDVIQDYEQALIKIILGCIKELPLSFGIKKVTGVLRGSKSIFIIDHELYKLDSYGILPTFKTKYLKTIIEKMIKHGLLEIEMVSEYKNLPTLIITQKGQNFLENKISENIKFVDELSDRDVILLNTEEQRLYDALRELRRDTAKEEDQPAYIICGNISLREMAKFKPETDAELLSITNIGEKFIQKYGYGFLEVIKSFVN